MKVMAVNVMEILERINLSSVKRIAVFHPGLLSSIHFTVDDIDIAEVKGAILSHKAV